MVNSDRRSWDKIENIESFGMQKKKKKKKKKCFAANEYQGCRSYNSDSGMLQNLAACCNRSNIFT